MRFTETPLAGAFVIELEPIVDERGFFARAWDANEFEAHGLDATIAQTNLSRTEKAGTFRGFHWQDTPHGEAKTIRCVSGAVFDVIVDMRPESDSFRQWFGVELSSDNLKALYVPPQFANGFLILADDTILLYNTTKPFQLGTERGMRWDDESLAVEWPRPVEIVSAKDAAW